MDDEIKVSIHCLAYNHANYIEQAIQSFLRQKCNFKFEVLIHDDASKDGTADIIRKYEKMYPDIIKGYYQKENQYSKGVYILGAFQYPRMRGKYVAVCEGDDYWIDENKLQKQYDYLESHEECSLVFHNAIVVDVNNKVVRNSFMPKNVFYENYFKDSDSLYSCDEIIKLDFAPTNSLFFRRKDVPDYLDFFNKKRRVCGDLAMRIFFSSRGYAFFFKDKMSAYRSGVSGSASQLANESFLSRIKTLLGHIDILEDFNLLTNGLHEKSIKEAINLKLFCYYFAIGSAYCCKNKQYRQFFKRASFMVKLRFFMRCHFPRLYRLVSKAK